MEDFFAGVSKRWAPGEVHRHWHVLPPTGLVRDHLTERYWGITSGPDVARVEPEDAHITVWHGAPADSTSPETLDKILAEVRAECREVPPFTAVIRRPEAWRTAIVCPVYGPPLRQLWDIVRRAEAGQPAQGPKRYFPHMSLAYGIAQGDDHPIRERLYSLDYPEVTVFIDALTLVSQKHDRRSITWTVDAVIPLGVAGREAAG
jgi:2'-5' RNA ligase